MADLCQSLPAYQDHFDLITSFFVLNDVSDYRGFLTTLELVLKRADHLVLFMNNPYSLVVRGHITNYFAATGSAVPYRGLAEAGVPVHLYHRTLEEYLAASHSAGLQLQHLNASSKKLRNSHCHRRSAAQREIHSSVIIPHVQVGSTENTTSLAGTRYVGT